MFHSFFSPPARSKYSFIFFLPSIYTLSSARTTKSQDGKFFFFIIIIIIVIIIIINHHFWPGADDLFEWGVPVE